MQAVRETALGSMFYISIKCRECGVDVEAKTVIETRQHGDSFVHLFGVEITCPYCWQRDHIFCAQVRQGEVSTGVHEELAQTEEIEGLRRGGAEKARRVHVPKAAGSSPAPATNHPGRPLDRARDQTHEARKPWLSEGMSRRTWYRRKAERKTGE